MCNLRCTKLEMLDLSHNRIGRMVGLGGLVRLKRLTLSDNEISSIEGVDSLANLEVLPCRYCGWVPQKRLDRQTITDNEVSSIASVAVRAYVIFAPSTVYSHPFAHSTVYTPCSRGLPSSLVSPLQTCSHPLALRFAPPVQVPLLDGIWISLSADPVHTR